MDRLPGVSDEGDIDEPDADEEIVFRDPIVGGSASMFSQRKLRSHLMNKIHAVDFKLDGFGVVNILNTTSHVIRPSSNFGRNPCSRLKVVRSSFVALT